MLAKGRKGDRVSDPDPDARPSRSPIGWRPIALPALALGLVGIAAWWFWNSSDSDIRAVIAEAKARDIATTARELGYLRSPPDRLSRWDQLAQLATVVRSYANSNHVPSSTMQLAPFDPIPDALRLHHAALASGTLDEVLAGMDGMGDEPLVLHAVDDYSTRLPELSVLRQFGSLFKERAVLAPPEQAGREVRRLLRCCTLIGDHSQSSSSVRMGLAAIAFGAVTRRLGDLRLHDPGIATSIDALCDLMAEDLKLDLAGEFVADIALVRNPEILNAQAGSAIWDRLMHGAMVRMGRETLLRKEMEWVLNVRDHPDPLVLLDQTKALARELNQLGSLDKPKYAFFSMFAPNYRFYITRIHDAILYGRLLSAELRGRPWPIDVLDPAHQTMRRVERDGKVMGAYSLNGSDTDAHGKAPNRYFPLYGPLEPPTPAVVQDK